MKMIQPSEAFRQIEAKPELKDLWDATQASLPNCIIQPYSINEFIQKTGGFIDRPDFVCSVIDPAEGITEEYIISVIIGPNALVTDIAHEITHLYIHGRMGFPIPWLAPDYWKIPQKLAAFDFASHIHSISIHPVIDKIVKGLNLFNTIIYSRIASEYRKELKNYSKNPNSVDKDYFLVKTVAAQHRLPPEYWEKIQSEFAGRGSFLRLQNRVNSLPDFPEELNPKSIYDYVLAMWNEFRLDTVKHKINLCFETPLKYICNEKPRIHTRYKAK